MARQKNKKQSFPVALVAIVAVILLCVVGVAGYFLLGGDKAEVAIAAKQCLPPAVETVLAAERDVKAAPAQVNIYLDGSGGMAGYVSDELGTVNIVGNLISAARNFTQSAAYTDQPQGNLVFRSFGEKVGDPIETPEIFARPDAYRCPQGGCDNQETHIDTLLRTINAERKAAKGKAASELNVIVTDLMLDNPAAADSFEASVGGQLRTALIENNLAIGIMGVKTGFSGTVYYQGQKFTRNLRRPLVMIMIGQPKHIRAFYDYLTASGIPDFDPAVGDDRMAFALFGQEPGTMQVAEPRLLGTDTGFSRTRLSDDTALQARLGDLPQFTADPAADGAEPDTGLAIEMAANASVAPYEIIGRVPRYAAQIWRLNAGAIKSPACAPSVLWTRIGALPNTGWIVKGQEIGYLLSMKQLESSALRNPGTYLVQTVAGQTGLQTPHPASAWMDAWSMPPEAIRAGLQQGAPYIGAPGLAPLRAILENELKAGGRDTIPRSASHFVLQTQ